MPGGVGGLPPRGGTLPDAFGASSATGSAYGHARTLSTRALLAFRQTALVFRAALPGIYPESPEAPRVSGLFLCVWCLVSDWQARPSRAGGFRVSERSRFEGADQAVPTVTRGRPLRQGFLRLSPQTAMPRRATRPHPLPQQGFLRQGPQAAKLFHTGPARHLSPKPRSFFELRGFFSSGGVLGVSEKSRLFSWLTKSERLL